jgi:hypothetical protein
MLRCVGQCNCHLLVTDLGPEQLWNAATQRYALRQFSGWHLPQVLSTLSLGKGPMELCA